MKNNKQEQIEEMAKMIDNRLIEANCWLGTMYKGIGRWIAQTLVEHYQPKLPKDSVVLSKEEYERITKEFVTEQRATEIAKEYFEKTRKETAEKFLQLAYDRCLEKSFIKKVEELAKQFSVEIKE